jgi:hypothetical protein
MDAVSAEQQVALLIRQPVAGAFVDDRVSASLQLGWRVARLNVADDGVVRGRSNGDCLTSKPMEEQTSCF